MLVLARASLSHIFKGAVWMAERGHQRGGGTPLPLGYSLLTWSPESGQCHASPAGGSTEGAFVRRHLAPITVPSKLFFCRGGDVLMGPGVGCEERPCPHTPTWGRRVNRAPLMWLDEIPATFSWPSGDKSLCRM